MWSGRDEHEIMAEITSRILGFHLKHKNKQKNPTKQKVHSLVPQMGTCTIDIQRTRININWHKKISLDSIRECGMGEHLAHEVICLGAFNIRKITYNKVIN